MNSTQLPAELAEKLNREAFEKFPIQLHRIQNGLPTDLREYEREIWLSGATKYAIEQQELRMTIKKAKQLLKRVYKDFIGTVEMSDRKADRILFTQIKKFLDGTN